MIDSNAALLSSFLIGFLGSTHCLGMCGGISSALSLQTPTGEGFYGRLLTTTSLYNLGRLTSYSLMGAVVGYVGVAAADTWASLQVALRTLASIMLIFAGVYLTGLWNGLQPLERLGAFFLEEVVSIKSALTNLTGLEEGFFPWIIVGLDTLRPCIQCADFLCGPAECLAVESQYALLWARYLARNVNNRAIVQIRALD